MEQQLARLPRRRRSPFIHPSIVVASSQLVIVERPVRDCGLCVRPHQIRDIDMERLSGWVMQALRSTLAGTTPSLDAVARDTSPSRAQEPSLYNDAVFCSGQNATHRTDHEASSPVRPANTRGRCGLQGHIRQGDWRYEHDDARSLAPAASHTRLAIGDQAVHKSSSRSMRSIDAPRCRARSISRCHSGPTWCRVATPPSCRLYEITLPPPFHLCALVVDLD